MATITAGTNGTASLIGLRFSAANSAADVAALNALMIPDRMVATGVAIRATGTIAATTVVTNMSSIAGINAGMVVLGIGIDPATYVISASGSSVILSKSAAGSTGGVTLAFVPPTPQGEFFAGGVLTIPDRGVLTMKPGDVVLVDPVTGWPTLISAAAATTGPWTLSA